jgi:mercuric ion binding protein
MKIRLPLLLPALLLTSVASLAAEKSITLSVPDMNCPSCPYIVEQSVNFIDGVQSAKADLKSRTCSVVYNDAIASVEDILGATADIGYKSTVIKQGNGS